LVRKLRDWLREASDPIGSLPPGTDPAEWAVRRFIASWVGPVRASVRKIEDCLRQAEEACRAGDMAATATEIGLAQQLVSESLRDELGLYSWDDP
jgi:hypothetical protein